MPDLAILVSKSILSILKSIPKIVVVIVVVRVGNAIRVGRRSAGKAGVNNIGIGLIGLLAERVALELGLSESCKLVDAHLEGGTGVVVMGDYFVVILDEEVSSVLILGVCKAISVAVLAVPVIVALRAL